MKFLSRSLFIFFILSALSQAIFAITSGTYAFTQQEDAKRFAALTHEIRCVVCQNQTIADSDAPLANDLREKVYRMVLANKTNADIQNFLVSRYGEFILLKPRFRMQTLVLWLFPFLSLVFILMFFLRFIPKRQSNVH